MVEKMGPKMRDWLTDLTIDDFPLKHQEFIRVAADVVGEQPAIALLVRLSRHYAKQGFYFRSLRDIETMRKRRYIVERFNGRNHADLCRETDFCLTYVYEILSEERGKISDKDSRRCTETDRR